MQKTTAAQWPSSLLATCTPCLSNDQSFRPRLGATDLDCHQPRQNGQMVRARIARPRKSQRFAGVWPMHCVVRFKVGLRRTLSLILTLTSPPGGATLSGPQKLLSFVFLFLFVRGLLEPKAR